MALGTIQVDFVANTAKFTGPTSKLVTQLSGVTGASRLALTGITKLGTEIAGVTSRSVRALTSLRTAVAGVVVAVGTGKLVSSLAAASEEVDKIGKASRRLGVTVEFMSALRFAAGEANVEFDGLAKMAGKASREIAKMVAEGATTAKLGNITVRLTDATGEVRSLTELLPELGRAIQSAGSQAEQLRLAESIFGRGGGDQFITLLQESGNVLEGLASGYEKARRLGVLFTDDQSKRLQSYNDSVYRLEQSWLGVKVALATELAPAATKLLDELAGRVAEIPKIVRAVTNAFDVFRNGTDEQKSAAAVALDKLRSDATGVLETLAKEGGRLFGIAFAENLAAALASAAPVITDVLRDSLAPLVNSIPLPGFNLNPSNKGELRRLEADLAEAERKYPAYLAMLKEIEAERQSMPPGFSSTPRLQSLEAQAKYLKVDPRAALEAVLAQRRAVEAEATQRGLERTALFDNAIAAVMAQAGEAQSRIVASIEKFDESKKALLETFAPRSPSSVEPTVSYTKIWGAAEAALTRFGRVVQYQAGQIGDAAAKIHDKLREAASVMVGLDVRSLRATGQDDAADRMEMILRFQQERADIIAKFGASSGVLARALEVQGLELQKLDGAKLKALAEEAAQVRLDALPEESLRQQLERIEKLREQFPTILDEGVMQKLRERAGEAIEQARAAAGELGAQLSQGIKGFASSASDAFADMAVDGKASFNELLRSWTKTLVSMSAKNLVFQPAFNAIGASFGSNFASIFSALGNVFEGGNLVPFAAGGVVTRPVQFPLARGVGIMGKAGPGAIMPLDRVGGRLGVNASGMGVNVTVIDQRSGGAPPQVTEGRGPDGRKAIRILIRDEVREYLSDGGGDRTLSSAFGLRRRGVSR